MPYALPEKQREYQRKWMAKNKKPFNPDLRRGVVTWKELQDLDKYLDIKTYDECLKEAKKLISTRRVNLMAIAALVIQSCRIRHGGDFRSKKYKDGFYGKTITEFAKELGINHRTLGDWIRIKIEIFDKLPKEESFDFTAATLTIGKHAGRVVQGLDPVTRYFRYKNNHTDKQTCFIMRYVSSALSAIKLARGSLTTEQRDKVIEQLKESLDLMGTTHLPRARKR